jgi:hypothetical protein
MNFFRSEEHLRRWEGYEEKSEYMAGLVGELESLPDAGDFWRLSPIEKGAFKLAMKLGLM